VRAVLDTNILVSSILSPSGSAGAVLSLALQSEIVVLCSAVLLAEFEEVLGRFMTSAEAADARGALEELSYLVEPRRVAAVSRDPDDDHVLAAAVAGKAEYIVTRDKDLLVMGSYTGIEIVEPGPFLGIVRAEHRR
jgi:putative PIN family toxin of toxin-antitoxin system